MNLRHGLALLTIAAGCFKTRPPAAVATKPTPVRQAFVGNGVEVKLDVVGWRPRPAAGSLGYHAERLALLERDRAEQVSIEIDDPPDGLFMTLADLMKHGLTTNPGAKETSTIAAERFGDRPAIAYTTVTGAEKLWRRHVYASLLLGDKFIELHYSAPEREGALARGRAALEPMVRTLTLRRDASLIVLGQKALADITTDEVIHIASLFGCGKDREQAVCELLRNFLGGHVPAQRAEPVALAGIAFVVSAPEGVPLESGEAPAFVVLDKARAGFGLLRPTTDDDVSALAMAMMHDQPLPHNDTVLRLLGQRETWPGMMTGASFAWSDDERGWARELDNGWTLVVAEVPGGMAVGVFPKQ
jgi:hypothetical protein